MKASSNHGSGGRPAAPPRSADGYRPVTLREARTFPRSNPADHEHCAADPALLAELGAASGQHVRVTACGSTALFTLVESPCTITSMRSSRPQPGLSPAGHTRRYRGLHRPPGDPRRGR